MGSRVSRLITRDTALDRAAAAARQGPIENMRRANASPSSKLEFPSISAVSGGGRGREDIEAGKGEADPTTLAAAKAMAERKSAARQAVQGKDEDIVSGMYKLMDTVKPTTKLIEIDASLIDQLPDRDPESNPARSSSGKIEVEAMKELYQLNREDARRWDASALSERFAIDEALVADLLKYSRTPRFVPDTLKLKEDPYALVGVWD